MAERNTRAVSDHATDHATDHANDLTTDRAERFRASLRAYGRNATSFQLLESDFRVWFDESVGSDTTLRDTMLRDTSEGEVQPAERLGVHSRRAASCAVAYVDTGSAWVVGGEPLAPEHEVHAVAERFLDAAQRAGKRAAFFATEGRLVTSPRFERLLLGQQPVWDPAEWDNTVHASRSLRSQIRRAQSKNATVRELQINEIARGTPLRIELDALVQRWQAARAMAPMGFLVRLEPFTHAEQRHLFVAEQDGRVVALLSMAPVYARNGWLFEDLLRDRTAPNGTSELLVDAGMRRIAQDGVRWATLGLAPLAGPVMPWLARVRTMATPFFNFRGLYAFKAKLHPHTWEPIWLAHPASTPWWRALADALTAFANGSLFGFAWRTLCRGPQPVLLAMLLLLIPWTFVLAALDTARWYPEPWMQTAWVTFDTVLVIALALLVRRWRSWLGVTIATAVSVDATITLWNAVTWYGPRISSVTDALLTTIACAAPLLAAVVLWGTVRRQRHSGA